VALGDQIIEVGTLHRSHPFEGHAAIAAESCAADSLNALMSAGSNAWHALRRELFSLFRADSTKNTGTRAMLEKFLVPQSDADLLMPALIGDYTDFYASLHHARNVGGMFRPDNPLLPNYRYVPIGYHGRSSSIVVSGTPVRRPLGQTKRDEDPVPLFGPSRMLDYELEVGFFIGPGNAQGEPIPIDLAQVHVFGLCLLNDWSARDIQKWEYQPLGPFLAKNFASSVSPWVVSLEALEPFRTGAFRREEGDPDPLPYLRSEDDTAQGGLDIVLEVSLSSEKMRRTGTPPALLSKGNFRDMYWTIAQMVTHHASNGCNLRPGDLMGSGTVSGSGPGSQGCLLELARRGAEPVPLAGGETRKFLEDGDEVILRGYCERPGYKRIGFGECRGIVLPAKENC
jgi:fumarylacetoacetase